MQLLNHSLHLASSLLGCFSLPLLLILQLTVQKSSPKPSTQNSQFNSFQAPLSEGQGKAGPPFHFNLSFCPYHALYSLFNRDLFKMGGAVPAEGRRAQGSGSSGLRIPRPVRTVLSPVHAPAGCARGLQFPHLLASPYHIRFCLFTLVVALPRDVKGRNVSLKIRKHLMTSETEKKARTRPSAGSFCGHPAL